METASNLRTVFYLPKGIVLGALPMPTLKPAVVGLVPLTDESSPGKNLRPGLVWLTDSKPSRGPRTIAG